MGLTTSNMSLAMPAMDIIVPTVPTVPLLQLQFDEVDIDRYNMQRYSRHQAVPAIRQYLDSNANLSIEQASGVLYDMMPDTGPGLDFINYDMSLLFIQTAQQIPYSHPSQDKFVDLLASLARTDRFNKPLIPSSPRDHRFFGTHGPFAIALNQGSPLYPRRYTNSDEMVNLGAFVARLVRAKVLPRASYNTPASVLREALEYECHDPNCPIDASTRVAWCAVWILGAGRELYEKVVLHPDLNQKYYLAGELYRGPAFGIERWKFWQDRLAEIAGKPEVADDVRQLGLKAADSMGALARGISW